MQRHNDKAKDKEKSGIYIGILIYKGFTVHGLASAFKDNTSSCETGAVYARQETGRRSSDTGSGQSGSGGRVCACVDSVVSFLVVAHAVTCVPLSALLLATIFCNRNCVGAEANMSSNFKVNYSLQF